MRLAGIRPGDLVCVDHKGRTFLAEVSKPPSGGEVAIHPLKGSGVNYRVATSRQVIAHYKHRGERPPRVALHGGVS